MPRPEDRGLAEECELAETFVGWPKTASLYETFAGWSETVGLLKTAGLPKTASS